MIYYTALLAVITILFLTGFAIIKKRRTLFISCIVSLFAFFTISRYPFSLDLSELRSYSLSHMGKEIFSSDWPFDIEDHSLSNLKMYIRLLKQPGPFVYQEDYYCMLHFKTDDIEILISKENPEKNYIKKGGIYYVPKDPDLWLNMLQIMETASTLSK